MKSLNSKSLKMVADGCRFYMSTRSNSSFGEVFKELEEKLRSSQIESERRQFAIQKEFKDDLKAAQKELKDDLKAAQKESELRQVAAQKESELRRVAAQKEFKEDFKAINAEQFKSFEISIILKLSSVLVAAVTIFEYLGFYIQYPWRPKKSPVE